ncbi:MAG: factor-independent urate hydroxylase [Chthoniobacterales bacterium]
MLHIAMKLTSHQYGKQRVRVMKIIRDGNTQTVKELTIGVALQGDFETSYTAGDNSLVVATDTMKNTVQALAKDHLGTDTEKFLAYLGHHFVSKYPQVKTATISSKEHVWQRLTIGGAPHPHSFSGNDSSTPFSEITVTAAGGSAFSGIDNWLLLKSTGSSFVDYPRCEFTTLPETTDRVLATSIKATWKWTGELDNYATANEAIVSAMLVPFSNNHSPSAQTTLFEMGAAALAACPNISEIHIVMPNKHYILVPLDKFGLENNNDIFLPIDEPHGQIEATVSR